MTDTPTLGEVVAQQLKRHRKAQGLSQQQVADRTVGFGHPVSRATIAKLEVASTTRTENVSLKDVLVLAAALRISPTLLYVSFRDPEVEITPEIRLPPYLVLDWLDGVTDLPANHERSTPDEQSDWRTRIQPLVMTRKARELREAVWSSSGEPAEDEALRRYGTHLQYMEDVGLPLPQVPDLWRKRMVELGVRRSDGER